MTFKAEATTHTWGPVLEQALSYKPKIGPEGASNGIHPIWQQGASNGMHPIWNLELEKLL